MSKIINIINDAASLGSAFLEGDSTLTDSPYNINVAGNISVSHAYQDTIIDLDVSSSSNMTFIPTLYWTIGDSEYNMLMNPANGGGVGITKYSYNSYYAVRSNSYNGESPQIPNYFDSNLESLWVSLAPFNTRASDSNLTFSIPSAITIGVK